MIGIAIVVMDPGKESIPKIVIEIPQDYTLDDLMKFLKKQNNIPFQNFFLTNKIAERAQFAQQRKIKSIRSQCQELQGNILFLCYQSKINKVNHQTPQPPSEKQQVGKKKPALANDQNDNCCLIM